MNFLFVVIYVKGMRVKAHPNVVNSEEEAQALQAQVAHMHQTVAWVMAFPEPREIAND